MYDDDDDYLDDDDESEGEEVSVADVIVSTRYHVVCVTYSLYCIAILILIHKTLIFSSQVFRII